MMYWDWNFIDVKNKRAEVYTLQNIMVEKTLFPKDIEIAAIEFLSIV